MDTNKKSATESSKKTSSKLDYIYNYSTPNPPNQDKEEHKKSSSFSTYKIETQNQTIKRLSENLKKCIRESAEKEKSDQTEYQE